MFREDKQGVLKPGAFADYIVLNNDFFSVPEDQIGKIYPLMTVIGGKTMMLREEFAKELGRDKIGPQVDWSKPPSFGGGDMVNF